jgi:hypothetical protein
MERKSKKKKKKTVMCHCKTMLCGACKSAGQRQIIRPQNHTRQEIQQDASRSTDKPVGMFNEIVFDPLTTLRPWQDLQKLWHQE